jgi:surface polysaccharide O-acyltransferase-like enzyme
MNKQEEKQESKKLIHLELLRIIAAFLVIFNHTGNRGYFLFSLYDTSTIQYWLYMVLSVICQISVPLFLMISGALLLKKDLSAKDIFKKISRMLIVLLVFTVIYYVRLHILKYSSEFSVKDFFLRLYKGDIIVPFWYLYAYIAFLLTFPFLRNLVKNLPESAYQYLIILSIIFISILPSLEYRFTLNEITLNKYGNPTWIFVNIFIFPLIGYYLENIVDVAKLDKKNILVFIFAIIFGIFSTCYMTNLKHRITGICNEVETQDFMKNYVLIIAIPIYIFTKYFISTQKIPNIISKIIISLGNCSFGIYLFHMLFTDSNLINSMLKALTKTFGFNHMIAILLLCVFIFMICYIITFILKKIPRVKKLI